MPSYLPIIISQLNVWNNSVRHTHTNAHWKQQTQEVSTHTFTFTLIQGLTYTARCSLITSVNTPNP